MGRADERLAAASMTPTRPVTSTLQRISGGADVVFVSGQVCTRDGTLLAEGRVGGDVSLEAAYECARQCARNVLETLQRELGTLDAVESVLRLGVYVASSEGFSDQHLVAHAASQLVIEVLGDAGRHTRTAIGVASLPTNSPVEVDATVKLGTAR